MTSHPERKLTVQRGPRNLIPCVSNSSESGLKPYVSYFHVVCIVRTMKDELLADGKQLLAYWEKVFFIYLSERMWFMLLNPLKTTGKHTYCIVKH
jgi:hypothetical protein